MARGLRLVLLALISLGSLAATLYFVGIDTVISTLGSIHPGSVVVAGLLVLVNSLLSLVRFRSVLRSMGFHPGWRSLFFAHSIGQVSNQIFLNIVGQSLSRAAALAADGVPLSASVIATFWERIQAAAVLFLLSLISLWYLFVNIHFDLMPAGLSLLAVLFALGIACVVVIATVLRPAGILDRLPEFLRAAIRLWPSVVITLLAHACMLGAYLTLLWGIGVTRSDGSVIAALIVVMFTSSLPISFSGWGIREFSAARALGAIGVNESVAVASAVAIGLLYLFLVVIFAVISTTIVMRHRKKYAIKQAAVTPVSTGIDWGGISLVVAAGLCAMLLFFQLRIPTAGSELTANIADLIALTSIGLAPYFLWTHRHRLPLPKVLFTGLAAMSLVLAISLAYGYFRFGWTSWAFLNRGLGWLIILGYTATGIAIAMTTEAKRRLVLSTFVATGATIAALQILMMFALLSGVKFQPDVFVLPIKAYAGNANAFAVQMIMTSAAAVAAWHLGVFGRHKYLLPLILSLIAYVIYFCHSRAGIGMLIILLAVMILVPARARRRDLLPALLWPIATLLLCTQVGAIYPIILRTVADIFGAMALGGLTSSQGYVSTITVMLQVSMERQSGDLERWTSITEGWDMWLQEPLFGQGLGAFMHQHLMTMGSPLIIHSVPVWLLAETGLFGLLTIGAGFLGILVHAWRQLRDPEMSGWAVGLLLILTCLAAGSVVHDLFFQRSFWFMLGLLAVLPKRDQPSTNRA